MLSNLFNYEVDMSFATEDHIIKLTTIELEGRVDAFNAPDLRRHVNGLIDDGINRIIFDLSRVSFFDSAAMAVLVNTLKRARSAGGDVKLVWPQEEAGKRIIKLTKFDRVFDMNDTAMQARQSFGG
jgi:anti-sigma B factor antagonist